MSQENDLFNEDNTAGFARFLFESNQYNFAAEEYERLTFLFPSNQEYQLALLKSYRYANEYDKGIKAFQSLVSPGLEVQKEYAKINILDGNKFNIASLLSNLERESSFRNNLDLTLRLISFPDNPLSLEGIKTDKVDENLLNFYYESSKINYKSSFLAGSLSTFIPGMGKVYSGRWKDGLISFLFIGTTAFQAYRGFEQKGIKSVYGWIMGSLSFCFYIGNIYGSAKAAKLYNSHQNSAYVEKVTHYYIDHF
jgi:hypothetical protein